MDANEDARLANTRVAFGEAVRALAEQERARIEFRTRAWAVFSAAAASVSFVAGPTVGRLTDSAVGVVLIVLALVALCVVTVSAWKVLRTVEWKSAVGATKLTKDPAWIELSEVEFLDELVTYLHCYKKRNLEHLGRWALWLNIQLAFTIAAVVLSVAAGLAV